MISTPRQRKQQQIRQALGTVIGFHGYLNNLQTVLHRAGYYRFETIELMHSRLKCYENELRKAIKQIP